MIIERLFLFGALLSPTVLALWRSGFSAGEMVGPLAWATLAAMIPSALPRRQFLFIRVLVVGMAPMFLWWIGYAALNGAGPGWDAAVAAVKTNASEFRSATELVAKAPGCISTTLGFLFLLVAGFAVRYVPQGVKRFPTAETNLRNILLAISMLVFAASSVVGNTHYAATFSFKSSYPLFSPIGTLSVLAQTSIHRAVLGDLSVSSQNDRQRPKIREQLTAPELAIFVVGESVRAGDIGPAHASRGPWTKALVNRIDAGLGAWAPSTCAGSYGTHLSVPLLLTGLPPRQFSETKTAPSALAILKASGFSTAWISNQDPTVFRENGHDFYWAGDSIAGSLDENAILVAQSFVAPLNHVNTKSKPRAVLLHMFGSHFEYIDRYPADLFPPEPMGLNQDQLIAERYSRSEEYTAKLLVDLSVLIDKVPYPAFLVFSSDHGENLPGDHNGLLTHLGPRASIHDGTTTTLFLWNKSLMATGRQKLLSLLLEAKVLAQADVARAFLALAGIDEKVIVPTRDPEILAPIKLGDRTEPHFCRALQL